MPVNAENVFQCLFKWGDAESKEEDFYSRSLILIIKKLKQYDPKLTTSFAHKLLDFPIFGPTTEWNVDGQIGKDKRLDILFEAADLKAVIEVKWGSKPDKEQLLKYGSDLLQDIKDKKIKWDKEKPPLFLLTKFGADKDFGIPFRHISWVNVCACLGELRKKLDESSFSSSADNSPHGVYYLVHSFHEFLMEKGLGVKKLEDFKGIKCENLVKIRDYLYLIKQGCLSTGLFKQNAEMRFGRQDLEDWETWAGWIFLDKKSVKKKPEGIWFGFEFDEPERLMFGIYDDVYKSFNRRSNEDFKRNIDKEFKGKPHRDWHDEPNEGYAEFILKMDKPFCELEVNEQIKYIKDFVEEVATFALVRKNSNKK